VLLAWAVFFLLAAWVLPPLDSRLQPTPLVYRSVLTLTILLALPTVIVELHLTTGHELFEAVFVYLITGKPL
jgi:hypothetical protein